MTEEWQELIGAELAGFRLAKLIGVGGQAAVFLGINDARRGQRRAIKVVVPLLARDRTFEARFLEEAEVLERLSHPNIVAFRDVRIAPATRGHESIGGGARFMALELELLEGHSLREVADAGYELKPWKVLEWIAQAADGLAAAHALGVIHRDIKPGNIFIV
ncbi:MAG: protein kinase, partial [Myxococcales bacterium]|nr:protein kinase [Myxococcales bacterium]